MGEQQAKLATSPVETGYYKKIFLQQNFLIIRYNVIAILILSVFEKLFE